MSEFNETRYPDFGGASSSTGNGGTSRQYVHSNLQATAPEYHPLNTNRGAIKKSYRNSREYYYNQSAMNKGYQQNFYNGDGGRYSEESHYSSPLNTQEHHSTGTGVKKKGFNRNRGGYSNNWRSSHSNNDCYAENYNSKSRKFKQYNNNSNNSNTYGQEPEGEVKFYEPNSYEESNYQMPPRNEGHFSRHSQKAYQGYYYEPNDYTSSRRPRYKREAQNGYGSTYEQSRKNHNVTNSERNSNQPPENNYPSEKKAFHRKVNKTSVVSSAGQRERLTEMIDSNLLECLVCCEKIKRTDKVWSCSQCYHIIHLSCTSAWAKSSQIDQTWRCPACQNSYNEVPKQYTCYCGKVIDPKINPNIIAHGCDNACLRKGKNCEHKCNILCHPGPCPDCNIMAPRLCGCGATQQIVKCCSDFKVICQGVCNKLLNCGLHKCTSTCHPDPCMPCAESIIQECHCGKTGRKVPCNRENAGNFTFSCDNICEKLLQCGNHHCRNQCHPGQCSPCESDINVIKTCCCGKTKLETPRLSCLDPIPCCDNICGKTLICGPPSKPHTCKSKCHKGKCPPCALTTVIKCRCGHMDKEVACQKVTTKADDARCEKKCVKKRLCGKHTCKQKCCIEIEHICPLPCNKMLTCGLHKCELTCHSGRCPPCMETSFEELYCECGASVLYPPVPCGTKPPTCDKPCSKNRACGHHPNHDCHTGNCPPCFVLTKKWCYGQHEQRGTIPCHQESFSCGLPCGKPMACGRHKCIKQCHNGECPLPCAQPCTSPRSLCGHPCNKPCHSPPCPESCCKQMVPVTCLCGLQKAHKICTELTEEYKAIEMANLKDKMDNLSSYQTIDLSETKMKKPSILKILECTEECRVLERNRRLAIGLQIQNPDLSQKLTPRYSDFLKQWAKKDSKFCQRVHDKLSELVQLSKQSKQKSRSYSFESMNRDKRHFIHEYCEYFGIESAAYDAEPNRNVIATAIKDKSWLPSMSLLEVLQRENGQRKVPGPVLGYRSHNEGESVSLKLLTSAKNL